MGKPAGFFIQCLRYTNDVAFHRSNRDAHYAARYKTGLFIYDAIKSWVRVSIVNNQRLVIAVGVSGDTACIKYADFAVEISLCNPRVKFVGCRIVEE